MAAEYSANAVQNVLSNSSVIFDASPVPNPNDLIFHRDENGIFRLASPSKIVGNWGGNWNWLYGGCACCRNMPEALYQVSFHGNMAIPTGGTVEAISLAISIDGTVDPSSTMIFTPAAVEEYGNVGADIIVAVPAICGCESVSVVNTSTQTVLVQNANLLIDFIGVRN